MVTDCQIRSIGNLVVRFGAGMFNHPHGLHVVS